jgi:23S rRNA-/tRNA-specific pseudouridylate synthase
MAHLGCPILGDARYGGGGGAMHLLARALVLPGLTPVQAAIPEHMRGALARCGIS